MSDHRVAKTYSLVIVAGVLEQCHKTSEYYFLLLCLKFSFKAMVMQYWCLNSIIH